MFDAKDLASILKAQHIVPAELQETVSPDAPFLAMLKNDEHTPVQYTLRDQHGLINIAMHREVIPPGAKLQNMSQVYICPDYLIPTLHNIIYGQRTELSLNEARYLIPVFADLGLVELFEQIVRTIRNHLKDASKSQVSQIWTLVYELKEQKIQVDRVFNELEILTSKWSLQDYQEMLHAMLEKEQRYKHEWYSWIHVPKENTKTKDNETVIVE